MLAVLMAFAPALAAAADGWPAVIRPQVVVGNGSADYAVELFTPIHQTTDSLLFFAPKFRLSPGADETEFNLGLGYRKLVKGGEWFVGGSVFFDTMESNFDNRYNQVGVGLEARSKNYDLFLNGYLTVGDDKEDVPALDTFSLGSHDLLVREGFEEALSGVDGEVGMLLPGISDYVTTRAYLGGYWWDSSLADDITGVRARVQVNPAPILTFNAVYSYDDTFEGIWRADTYLNIPFSIDNMMAGKSPFEGVKQAMNWGAPPPSARERMTDRVERDLYIRTVDSRQAGDSVSAVPFHSMLYVDNANTTGTEDGSLENPYSTLANAEAAIAADYADSADLPYVYIFAGTGAYTGGLDLSASMTATGRSALVWGEHYALPGMTAGAYPVIDGGLYGLSLDAGVDGGSLTVRGLEINNTGGDAIYGTNLLGASVYDNVIANNSGYGINLELLTSGTADLTASVYDNTISGHELNALVYAEHYGTGNIDIDMSGNASDGGFIGLAAIGEHSGTGDVNISAAGNLSDGSFLNVYADGWHIGDGDVNVTVSGNETNDGYIGVYASGAHEGATGNVNLSVSGNTADSNYVNIAVLGYTGSTGDLNASIAGNLATSALGGEGEGAGIYAELGHEGVGDLNLTASANTASGNEGSGMDLYAYHGGTGALAASLGANQTDNNYGDGISLEAEHYGTGALAVTADGNTASGNEYYGLDLYAYSYAGGSMPLALETSGTGTTDLTVTVTGNTAMGNGFDGIYADAEHYGTGDIGLTMTGNTASGNYWTNMNAYAYHGLDGDIDVTVSGNQANNSQYGDGIYVYAEHYGNTGNISLALTGNTASNNDDTGIEAYAYNGYADGNVSVTVTGNTASENEDEGIYAGAENYGATGDLTMTVSGNTANSNEDDEGIDIYMWRGNYGTGNTSVAVTGNTASLNYGDGVVVYAGSNATGTLDVTVTGNTTSQSKYDSGLDIYAEHDGTGNLNLDVSGNSADSNRYANIYAYAEHYGEGDVAITATGNTAGSSVYEDGLVVHAYHGNDGNISATVGGNTTGGNDYGLYVDLYRSAYYAGNVTLDLTGNSSEGNDTYDLYANLENDGVTAGENTVLTGSGNTYTSSSIYLYSASGTTLNALTD